MNVSDVLNSKGWDVVTAKLGHSVSELADILAKRNIGALVIVDDNDDIAGILSERDVVRRFARDGSDCGNVEASEIMTKKVLTCSPEDGLLDVMSVMTENRIRHLPVLKDGKLAGIVTIGDMVKNRLAELEQEAEEMKRYIAG